MQPIFIIYYNLGLGGIQKKIVDIINFLGKEKPNQAIYLLLRKKKNDFDLAFQVKNQNLKIIYYLNWLPVKLPFFFSIFVFWETLKLKPKSIITFADLPTFPAIWTKIILFKRKINIVVNVRSYTSWDVSNEKYGRVRNVFIKLFYKFADKIICLTLASQNDLIKNYNLSPEKIAIISNWTAIALDRPLKTNKKYDLIFMGRLIKSKGIYFLLQSILKIKEMNDIKLLIIGNGVEKNGILDFIKRKKLERNIIFSDAKYDIKEFLCQSKILVCPSEEKAEGFPTSVLEAMAMKIPVVCRRFAGVEDVIKDNENGFIADTMDQFINKMNKLLEDKILYDRIAKQAKEDVIKNHSLKNINQYLKVARIS